MTRCLARAFSALAVAVVLIALPVALDACEVTCQAPHQTMPAAGAHCHHSVQETATIGHLVHACRQGHGASIPGTHDVRNALHGASPVHVDLAVAPTTAPPWQASRLPPHSPGEFSRVQNSPLRI